jgi:hypothetical protein
MSFCPKSFYFISTAVKTLINERDDKSFLPSVAYRALLSLYAWLLAAGIERHLPVTLSYVENLLPSKMLSSLAVTSLLGALSLTHAKKGE